MLYFWHESTLKLITTLPLINALTPIDTQSTLGVLTEIPFKLRGSIHVTLQKIVILYKKNSNIFFSNKITTGEIGLYFENNEKNC